MAGVCLLLAACTKDDHALVVTAKPTLLQYVSTDTSLTLFKAACQRAGMLNDSTFGASGPYTLFAPNDTAMKAGGLTADQINNYDPATLRGILQYHVVQGRLSSTSLVGFYTQDVLSQNTRYKPTLTKNYFGFFLNGIPVVEANIAVGDGVVHKIGRVAFPPAGNLMDMLNNAPDLTMMATAMRILRIDTVLVKKDPADVTRAHVQGTTPDSTFTMFAPTDAAFHAFGYTDTMMLKQLPPAQLARIFNYYFRPGSLYTGIMKGGMVWGINFLYQDSYRYYTVQADGFTIQGNGNISPIHIIRPDNTATNGVLHVIDQIIIP